MNAVPKQSETLKSANEPDTVSVELRARLVAAGLEPLWESKHAHQVDGSVTDDGHIWRWSETRAVMMAVGEVSSPRVVERRVLSMLDPHARYRDGDGTVGAVNATLQMLKPGEQARPHRHSMNALRFVLESSGGAKTVVDGKVCPMEPGDLVLTPAWCWHTHVHEGTAPVIWLDVLDVALHRFLGTEQFQPGPMLERPAQLADDAFAAAGFVPVVAYEDRGYSPLFRYPWDDALRALQAAPPRADGTRTVRYANPLNNAECLALLDCSLTQIDAGGTTSRTTVVADTVFCAVEGSGTVTVGNTVRQWVPKDAFTVPAGRPYTISGKGSHPARLFAVSNAPLFRKLGLYSSKIED